MAPLVSVVIPAYDNAAYLGAAMRSVLEQSHDRLELVVVNDASPDDVAGVVTSFDDPRIRYVVHPVNRGLSAARNTGIRASSGEILAFLDGDDLFHSGKLAAHVQFLASHPEIGATYNARFELDHSADTIRDVWRPPKSVSLPDLTAGFPFSPSDMVVRRTWAERVGLFDERYVYVAEDLDFNCRLALAGCRLARVEGVHNSRRYHAGRVFTDIRWWMANLMQALEEVYADPRCPDETRARRDEAVGQHLLLWSAIALAQEDTALGREYCEAAVSRVPRLLAGSPSPLVEAFVAHSLSDHTAEHEPLLRRMLEQLPRPLAFTARGCDHAVGLGYLTRGVRAALWQERDPAGHFEAAVRLGARIDRRFLEQVAARLTDCAAALGADAARAALGRIWRAVTRLGTRGQARWLAAHYSIAMAFAEYGDRRYERVPGHVLRAVSTNPEYLVNRGVLSILFRSVARRTASGLLTESAGP